MTVRDAVKRVEDIIRPAAQEEAPIQSRDLVAYSLDIPRSQLFSRYGDRLTFEQKKELFALAARRREGEPLQYLIGSWDFMGFSFRLNYSVLIPRPETELLCETATEWIKETGKTRGLDLCCGSGCIGISIQKLTGMQMTLADISTAALRTAAENARQLDSDVRIIQSDLFTDISEKFDLIVCNPPYLSESEMSNRQKELYYEPEEALYGGPDGLEFYRRIAERYQEHLYPYGKLMLEFGSVQEDAVRSLFPVKEIRKDYAGLPRLAVIENA